MQFSINDLNYLSLGGSAFRSEIDGNGNFVYIGYALPGSLTSESKWQIQKFLFDGTFNVPLSITFPNGNSHHDFIWDNRATYSYS